FGHINADKDRGARPLLLPGVCVSHTAPSHTAPSVPPRPDLAQCGLSLLLARATVRVLTRRGRDDQRSATACYGPGGHPPTAPALTTNHLQLTRLRRYKEGSNAVTPPIERNHHMQGRSNDA